MATKVLSNEFMQNIATDEAWKELSSSFNWSEALLEKHCRAESQAAGRGNYGISDSLRVRYRVICLIPYLIYCCFLDYSNKNLYICKRFYN